ncbi:MAG: CopG family transcriptional regulator [Deltaproteobacteria bacterium]|nr:CopG family transcriptional regulator [Deltaproteobacteria bacterium]
MIRTQISLAAWEYRLAKQAARAQGISLAELLRRALRLLLPVSQKQPWMQHIGMVESGNPRSSQQIDDIVYGQKD